MKNTIQLCLLFSLGQCFGMNVPDTTTLPKQPREETTTLPKDPRGVVPDNCWDIFEPFEPAAVARGVDPDAINLGNIAEPLEPAAVEMDLVHKKSSTMDCGQTVDLATVDMAVFQTTRYGVSRYPPGQNCQWTLEAPAGATVELYFSMFDLAYGDWFIVRGKDYYWGSIYQPIALPIQLGSDENSISFRFYSNNDRSRGWGFR